MINKIQVIAICILIVLGIAYLYTKNEDFSFKNLFLPGTPIVKIGEIPLRVEIANNNIERTQGLSGRVELEGIDGMLFVFESADYHGIWMKSMRFPIDIIWIDEELVVINIEKNVSPDTYPRTFRPERPARYAVETNPRYADTFGIRAGLKVRLPENYLED